MEMRGKGGRGMSCEDGAGERRGGREGGEKGVEEGREAAEGDRGGRGRGSSVASCQMISSRVDCRWEG